MSATAREIIEQAQQLPAEDRRAIISALAESLWTTPDSAAADRPAPDYREWLEVAGAFHSDYTDISSNKGKHLAEALYGRRAPRD